MLSAIERPEKMILYNMQTKNTVHTAQSLFSLVCHLLYYDTYFHDLSASSDFHIVKAYIFFWRYVFGQKYERMVGFERCLYQLEENIESHEFMRMPV